MTETSDRAAGSCDCRRHSRAADRRLGSKLRLQTEKMQPTSTHRCQGVSLTRLVGIRRVRAEIDSIKRGSLPLLVVCSRRTARRHSRPKGCGTQLLRGFCPLWPMAMKLLSDDSPTIVHFLRALSILPDFEPFSLRPAIQHFSCLHLQVRLSFARGRRQIVQHRPPQDHAAVASRASARPTRGPSAMRPGQDGERVDRLDLAAVCW
jgi:hypothetical protein